MKSRILLVDDHQIVLDGLKRILEDSELFDVVGCLTSGNEALRFIENLKVDLIMTDLDMPKMHGTDLVKEIRKVDQEIRIMVLSMHNDPVVVKELNTLGINGFLVKTSSEEEIVLSAKMLVNGKSYYSPEVTSKLIDNSAEQKDVYSFNLSERELEILQLVADGYSAKEIGEKIFISKRTVDSHRLNIMRKLDVKNTAGLIRTAFKNNLID